MSAGAGGAEQPRCGRIQVTQQPIADSVVRDGIQRAVHVVEQLLGAGAFALGAVESDRIDGGEPADRPAQVDVGFEHRPARPAEVDGDAPVTDRGRRSSGSARPAAFRRSAPAAGAARRRSRLSPRRSVTTRNLARSG